MGKRLQKEYAQLSISPKATQNNLLPSWSIKSGFWCRIKWRLLYDEIHGLVYSYDSLTNFKNLDEKQFDKWNLFNDIKRLLYVWIWKYERSYTNKDDYYATNSII